MSHPIERGAAHRAPHTLSHPCAHVQVKRLATLLADDALLVPTSDHTPVKVNLSLHIRQLAVSKLRAKLSFRSEPDARPMGSLGGSTGVAVTFLANLDNAALSLDSLDMEELFTTQSAFAAILKQYLMRQLRMQVGVVRRLALCGDPRGQYHSGRSPSRC
jgi:hypothetical protein